MVAAVTSKACAQLLDLDKDEVSTARMGAEEIKQAA
jgi:hypothetical protein